MRLLTINTHSLIEPDYEQKLLWFADLIVQEQPDILALQEVNQPAEAPVLAAGCPGYVCCEGYTGVLREGNHGARLAQILSERGISYHWTWLPAKLGYDRYDEGLALFCRTPIAETRQLLISQTDDYTNWKTRKVLGIRTEGKDPAWFYTVHMGWWDDKEEPFENQWERLCGQLGQFKQPDGPEKIWLMGDFNSPSEHRQEGYDLVCGSGWQDTYALAKERDGGATVEGMIDGWKGCKDKSGMRLDYIFCSQTVPVRRSQVVCDGRYSPQVSDHYGVMVDVGCQENGGYHA